GFADLPNADAIIRAARDQMLAIRTESNRIKFFQGLSQRITPLAGGHIPELYGAVSAGAGEDSAIGTEREVVNTTVMTGERFDFFSRFQIPEFNLLIVTSSGE